MADTGSDRNLVQEKLRGIASAQKMFAVALLVAIAAVALAFLFQGAHWIFTYILIGVFLVCFFIILFTGGFLATQRCPNCDRPYYRSWKGGNFFTSRCVSCGIQLDGTTK